ncbi:hypothetical protein AAHA92_15357 [Salvia divinorum]|uniref:Uncharacterized protein n=1 Tax=Salvia divinorum TaxID=28513 RepID=A0ABD1HII6_SALDI
MPNPERGVVRRCKFVVLRRRAAASIALGPARRKPSAARFGRRPAIRVIAESPLLVQPSPQPVSLALISPRLLVCPVAAIPWRVATAMSPFGQSPSVLLFGQLRNPLERPHGGYIVTADVRLRREESD